MIFAAGILFIAGDKVLLLRRSQEGDRVGEWSIPGGKIEDGEDAESAAVRECTEEIGICPAGDRVLFARRNDGIVDYSTFLQRVPETFDATLNGEHVEYGWFTKSLLPEPMVPGAKVAVDKLDWDELQIAEAMVANDLTSPQYYMNVTLFDLRITGVGTAYRSAHDEFVYRPPEKYLNENFLKRCNGLLVIYEHPDNATMESADFNARVIGTILLPYLKNDEVWGIAKIYDDAAVTILENKILSTSPSVVFRNSSENTKVGLEDGRTLLIEGKPSLLDHLAICENGVWDKLGEPSGVNSVTATEGAIMADETEKKEDEIKQEEKLEEKKDSEASGAMPMTSSGVGSTEAVADRSRADAEHGEKLDKLLGCMDAMSKRMDAMESRFGPVKKDTVEGPPIEAKEPPPALEGGKAPAPPMAAIPDHSGEIAAIKKDMAAMRDSIPKELEPTEEAKFADAQAYADSTYQLHGSYAPRRNHGETLLGYRKRLASGMKKFSKDWKGTELAYMTDDVLTNVEKVIYADAAFAARHPADLPAGKLREITRRDPHTGLTITEFFGSGTFIQGMKSPARRLTGVFNTSVKV